MDVFVEQIIKRKAGVTDYLVILGIVLLGVVLILASVLFLQQFAVIVLVGVIYGAYYLITARNLEFEYSCTNDDFTVDKIINRRKRKRIASFDLRSVEEMGKYDAAKLEHRSFDKRVNVGVDDAGTDAWYFAVRVKDLGNTLLIFNPSDRVLDAIKPFLPRQVAIDAFRRH